MTKQEKLGYCAGCRDNFYNGNNPYGIKECWNLKDAKLVLRKEVSIYQIPPWKQAPRKFLSCYNQSGYIYTEPNREF